MKRVRTSAAQRPMASPDSGEPKAVPKDESERGTRRCAERDPHTDLAGPLRHGISQHAVEADRRQRQRQYAEQAKEHRLGPRSCQRSRDDLLHGVDVAHALIGIDAAYLALHGFAKRGRLAERANDQRGKRKRLLRVRQEQDGSGLLCSWP